VLETVHARLLELRPRIEGWVAQVRTTSHPNPPPQGGRERVRPPSAECLRR
jgi:hypothetical protein